MAARRAVFSGTWRRRTVFVLLAWRCFVPMQSWQAGEREGRETGVQTNTQTDRQHLHYWEVCIRLSQTFISHSCSRLELQKAQTRPRFQMSDLLFSRSCSPFVSLFPSVLLAHTLLLKRLDSLLFFFPFSQFISPAFTRAPLSFFSVILALHNQSIFLFFPHRLKVLQD